MSDLYRIAAKHFEWTTRERPLQFHVDVAPRGRSVFDAQQLMRAMAPPSAAGDPEAMVRVVAPAGGAPVVVIDCETREACVGERRGVQARLRLVRWAARALGAGTVLLTVTEPGRGEIGTIRVDHDRSFSVEPAWPLGSTRRRRARQVLYPLARAWCQLPQRGPRGRKARRT